MKKFLLVIFSLLILTGCNKKVEKEINNGLDFTLNLIKTENCNHVLTEYYNYDDRTIYFVCIDEIYLKRENGKDMTLKYYFQNVNQSFDRSIEKLVSFMKMADTLKDGGTQIYKNENCTFILCNTLDDNKDIYIGDETLEYQQGFCKNKKS